MKFLNNIDGANRLIEDANHRLVSDIEKARWDGKADGVHKHTKSDIQDFPTSLPASGGNADTINGFTVGTNVPSDAKFTDTNTITTINGKTGAITKADIVALGIPAQDTTYANATTTVSGLMSATDKSKLDGVETGANNYTHPSTHPASMITESTTKRFVSDTEKAVWNAKASTSVATSSTSGLFSSADKSKLDGVSNNANNYVLPVASSAIGGVKSGTDISVDGLGNVSVINDSHYHAIASTVTGNLQSDRLSEPSYTTGTISPTSKPMYDVLRADRTSFLPNAQIIVESSTDAGVTWWDAGVSNSTKEMFFTGQRPSIIIPLKNGVKSTDCMTRITITGMRYNVPNNTPETEKYDFWNQNYVSSTERYFAAEHGWIWVSSNSDRIYLKVEKATGSSSTSWIVDREAYLSGWSGGNGFSLSGSAFGGGTSQTGNTWNWRFTFRTCTTSCTFDDSNLSTSHSTSAQSLHHLKITGKNVWTSSNNYMYNDHMYSWDQYQNTTFPGQLKAKELHSTIANGTAPITVSSNTVVSNLNSDLLDGQHGSYYAPLSTVVEMSKIKINTWG